MKLLLFALVVATAADYTVKFDEPQPFVLLPSIRNVTFRPRSMAPESAQYPLGVEAVLSVALKVQQVFQGHSSVPRNFLVSPIAVAGALGQLMLGSEGEFRRRLGVLLTLQNAVQNSRFSDAPPSSPDVLQMSKATVFDARANSEEGSRMLDQRTRTKVKMAPFSVTRKDGLPGLELHRQLGGLIGTLSNPLQSPSSLAKSYLHMASAFFVNHDLEVNEQFVRAIIDFYGASLVPVNFSGNSVESQKLVNDWGSMQTGGLITNFLKHAPRPDTAVLQLVAIHFRGAWETPFIRQGTIAGYFETSNETKVAVNLMRGSFEDVPYVESERLGLKMVAIPYIGLECAMYVLLPNDDNPLKYEVANIVTSLNERDIEELIDSAKPRTVNVMFPRLSLTSSLNLAKALRKEAGHASNHHRVVGGGGGGDDDDDVSVSGGPSSPSSSSSSSSFTPDLRLGPSAPPSTTVKCDTSKSNVSSTRNQDDVQPRRTTTPASLDVGSSIVPGSDNIVFSSRTQEAADIDSSSDTPKPLEDAGPEIVLTGAARNGLFRVSDMIQEIALEINEAGTEAAAITGSTINYSGFVKNLKVDRPFMFFIRQEETKALLFWGTVVDPSS